MLILRHHIHNLSMTQGNLTASRILYLLQSTLRTVVVTLLGCLTFADILVETLEPATLLLKQPMRLAVLNKRTLAHYHNLIEV